MTSDLPPAKGLFCLPAGVDFPRALIAGLDLRHSGAEQAPDAMARVSVFVNTTRMRRRLQALYTQGPARLLPRIRLITELGLKINSGPVVPALRRRLELARLVQRLIQSEPTLAPESASFELAGSLTGLLDEMQGEGVSLEDIAQIDVSDQSGHWARSQRFLGLLAQYLNSTGLEPLDPLIVQRAAAEGLIKRWQTDAPRDPMIIAGSTGSRGTTRLLMEAVARLPNGAVVLPGVDRDMPADVWHGLTTPNPQHDHPQYRTAALAEALGLRPGEIPLWHDTPPAAPARNRLVSLALRPAPVTDGWLRDGPGLGPLRPATEDLTLVEAADPREEANAIALLLRDAVEDGRTAALVTPDRMLTRRVTAAMDRWGILPDDSAGEPLRQAPMGRLLRHAAALFGRPLSAESLLTLLKHPLVHGGSGRGPHLRLARELELSLRRYGPPFPDLASLQEWSANTQKGSVESQLWIDWIAQVCLGHEDGAVRALEVYTRTLTDMVDALLAGSDASDATEPWPGADGTKARDILLELAEEAPRGGDMTPAAFQALLSEILSEDVREPVQPWDTVMIWGTLEARVQGADVMILGGLNDGTWPETPAADPWLNRAMRAQAGLLVPERRIGLSAHDFQQAIAGPRVALTRAVRDADSETVPSRWLNRLLNLLEGLPEQGGATAVAEMRERGALWTRRARALDRPAASVPRAPRPSPCPPLAARPRKLSVTEIETLIRDPFSIYARRILRLDPLDTLRKSPDARIRGTVLHSVLEKYVPLFAGLPDDHRLPELLRLAEQTLELEVPWPAARRLWLARLSRSAPWFIETEARRQADATPLKYESFGEFYLQPLDFTLRAKADRIDKATNGHLRLYDYKTGTPPTASKQKLFNQQLLLEVLMAEQGAFEGVPAGIVDKADYIGLGARPSIVPAPLAEISTADTLASLTKLLTAFNDPDKGYTAQMARFSVQESGDYDQLSREGEWDLSGDAVREKVGS